MRDVQQAPPPLLWLDKQIVDRATAGGKGASLSQLLALGASAPPAFVLTTAAYAAFARALDLPSRASYVRENELPALRQRIIETDLPASLAAVIATGWREMQQRLGGVEPLAVRSSATAEDSASFSFAGLHDTILDILDLPQLEGAVKQCWASLWSERSVSYRRSGDDELDTATMAVVVQQLVCSDVSFVVFTADPISHRDDHLIISATYGLGETVVSGLVTPDHIVIDHAGEVESYQIGEKELMIIPGAHPGDGVREVPVPRFLSRQAALSNDQARAIGRMARDIAQRVGFPADIEGGIAANAIHLFQVRPITTLNGLHRNSRAPS